jgi:hypothetical protein
LVKQIKLLDCKGERKKGFCTILCLKDITLTAPNLLGYILLSMGCGIEAKILFVPTGQKDCSVKPELLLKYVLHSTAHYSITTI